jgi:hypothetical protein
MKIQVIIGLILLFVYEHISRINNLYPLAPHLRRLAHWFTDSWYRFGQFLSHLSAFLEHLHLEEVSQTLVSLIHPVVEILLSWTNVIKGYIVETFSHYPHPGMIILGSILLIFALDLLIATLRSKPMFIKKFRDLLMGNMIFE